MSIAAESQLRVAFFDLIFEDAEGWICICTAPPGDKSRFKQRFFRWPGEARKMEEFIYNEERAKNVWFCINLLGSPVRTKENCLPTDLLWADLDEVDPASLPIQPPIIIASSEGRYQAIWRLTTAIEASVIEHYTKRMAYAFGADKSGWDLTQLLRVPFTTNFKYQSKPKVILLHSAAERLPALALESLPEMSIEKALLDGVISESEAYIERPVPPQEELPNIEIVIYKYKVALNRTQFAATYTQEPSYEQDWSRLMWKTIHICLEVGMSPEETFVVMRDASCNKYKRDGRPSSHLWRDILKAETGQKRITALVSNIRPLTMPHFVDEPPTGGGNSFIEEYRTWAVEATDAVPHFHDLSAFIMLSAVVSNSVRLETSYASVVPNLWGMILGDSTLSRKAQPLDAKLMTPSGWRQMGDIKIGDTVVGKDGEPTTVTGISPRKIEDCYSVTFSDGAKTECSGDHLWTIKGKGKAVKWATWSLAKIVGQGYGKGNSRQIPMVDPVITQEVDLPIDPYVFGILLGDGHFAQKGSIRLSSADEEIIDAVRLECENFGLSLDKIPGDNCDYRLTAGRTFGHEWQGTHNPISVIIRSLGLEYCRSHEKFVPDIYLNGSTGQRLALLEGLLDSDGWVNKNTIHFSSSSKELALAVQYLVRSLGGWASFGIRPFGEFKPRHEVGISMPLGLVPFRLTRKAELYSNRSWARPRTITDISYVGKKETQCIKVAAEDGLYVTDDFIVTHNTTAMRMAIEMLGSLNPDLIVATDGTVEGLLTGLESRPNRTSIFFRDELSGFFDQINRRDYLAGMPEHLTHLYDVPPFFVRRLRKETIRIENPIFIFFGGGVRDRVFEALNQDYILSGFLPRFLVVSGDTDLKKIRPTGPAENVGTAKRATLLNKLADVYEHYASEIEINLGGIKTTMPPRISAHLTPEAWEFYSGMETDMLHIASDSSLSALALPTFERMSRSMLKMAVIVGAVRQEPRDEKITIEKRDVETAAWYIQDWGRYSIDLIMQAGDRQSERQLMKILRVIEQHPGMLRSQIMTHYKLNKREADEVLGTLEDRMLVRKEQQGRGWAYWLA